MALSGWLMLLVGCFGAHIYPVLGANNLYHRYHRRICYMPDCFHGYNGYNGYNMGYHGPGECYSTLHTSVVMFTLAWAILPINEISVGLCHIWKSLLHYCWFWVILTEWKYTLWLRGHLGEAFPYIIFSSRSLDQAWTTLPITFSWMTGVLSCTLVGSCFMLCQQCRGSLSVISLLLLWRWTGALVCSPALPT